MSMETPEEYEAEWKRLVETKDLDGLQKLNVEMKDRWLRALADIDNEKKRHEAEVDKNVGKFKRKFVSDLKKIVPTMRRELKNMEDIDRGGLTQEAMAVLDGGEIILKNAIRKVKEMDHAND